jgi:hypothetical protein
MWIHHFVILQLFHPKYKNVRKINFIHDNHALFVRHCTHNEFHEHANILNDTSAVYQNFLSLENLKNIFLDNDYPSTVFSNEENVDSIRKNAPKTFRSQYRLVTSTDYESFFLKIVAQKNAIR